MKMDVATLERGTKLPHLGGLYFSEARTTVESPYEDDDEHPIPFLGRLDVEITSDAGVRLGIVIASPLRNDERSRLRLIRKLEDYVREFAVLRERWTAESENPMKAWLYLSLHPESDPEIFQLIDQCRCWVEGESITFKISRGSRN